MLDPCKRLERDGYPGHVPAGGPVRPGPRRAGPRGADRQDDPRHDHGREQRDRHAPADQGHRQAVQGEGRPVPHRRGAGGRQGAARRRGDGHRPAEPDRPQDLRAEGASARCTSARRTRGSGSSRRSTAAATSAACAPARCRCRSIVGLRRRPARSPARRWPRRAKRTFRLRERLRKGIMDKLPESYLNGHPTERLPGNANISFAYVEGEGLMMGIKDVAVSSGSACTQRQPGAELRAAGPGRRRRTGPLEHPLRPRPVHHRGGSRFRRRPGRPRGEPPPRDVARSTRWPSRGSTSRRSSGRRTKHCRFGLNRYRY